MQRSVSTVTIIIPAFNEEQTIGDIISLTMETMDEMGLPYEVIVVDDGSTDKTSRIASSHKATVLSNVQNRGKGYALRRALTNAQGEIIVTMDSDGEHKPKEISDLILPLFHGADIVSGSRFLGKNPEVTTRLNRIGNFMFNIAIMTLTGKKLTDSQTGFRATRREILEKMNLTSNGYDIDTEITVKGLMGGFVFIERPISCTRRRYNVSKINLWSDGTQILKTIIRSSFSKMEH